MLRVTLSDLRVNMHELHQQRDDNNDDDDDDDGEDDDGESLATITMTNIETHSPHQPCSDSSRRLLPYLQDQTHHPALPSLNSCSAA